MNYHNLSKKEVFNILKSSERGLTKIEAAKRLREYGPNTISSEKKDNVIKMFFRQLCDFMTIILLCAATISVGISLINGDKDYTEPVIIMAIVVLNSIIGVIQQSRAEHAIDSLKKLSAPKANVIRDGILTEINAADLVVGDIIQVSTGDIICADAYILDSISLTSDESSLTGESIPSEKHEGVTDSLTTPVGERFNMLFSSCTVCQGHGKAIVTATGINTEVGNIANMIIQDTPPLTPLQKRLEHIGKVLGTICVLICIVLFVVGLILHIPPLEMFMTSVSLAVAAIPEGLPIIVTIMLSMGVRRMSQKGAIVRNLPAVETLGCASAICTDKTGTLTMNSMTVTTVTNALGNSISRIENDILTHAVLCCNSTHNQGDPTEQGIIRRAQSKGISAMAVKSRHKRLDELPFDSKTKLMATLCKRDIDNIIVVKGAFDILSNMCSHYQDDNRRLPLSPTQKKSINDINEALSKEGLRVIAVAVKIVPSGVTKLSPSQIYGKCDLTFLGLIAMMDLPRKNVSESIDKCNHAGIKTIMITGDHPLTAASIARKLGINASTPITGAELESMSDSELRKRVHTCNVFARVSPEHKVRIVKAFQANNHITAMTGDGVNDAPALKAADIGCAMGKNGTDVARGASDLILTDDNFTTIVDAVAEGRRIYDNIKKSISFLLSSNVGEIITVTVAIFCSLPSPLQAVQLLWINLVTDSLPAIALGMEKGEDDLMTRPPVKDSSKIFDKYIVSTIISQGVMIGALSLFSFYLGYTILPGNIGINRARTMAFGVLGLSQLFHSFNVKSKESIISPKITDNKMLIISFVICFSLQICAMALPISMKIFKVIKLTAIEWVIVLILSFLPIPLVELQKKVNKS